MSRPASDVAFSPSVKQVQKERGSRTAYARVEQRGGFNTELEPELLEFLQEIDTAFLATASADGQPYVQHRGGEKGFIRAVDEHTLGFIDWSGNRQYISTGNLRENDRVCLFLMDYERRQRVKLWGRAKTVPLTAELEQKLAADPERAHAEQVVLITVEAWDINCPQHIPQKVNVDEVAPVIDELKARIAALEAENRELRAKSR